MAIIQTTKQQLRALRRENAALRASLTAQRELLDFVALAAADIDLEALLEEDADGAV
ncbi:MAG: hypothetical protein K5990_05010 [Oscillospiraceae bacterium]|nr:hypothetical protein [Oscillospiraceae bacterium]